MSIKKTVRDAIAREKKASREVWLKVFCAAIATGSCGAEAAGQRADAGLLVYNAKFKNEL